MKKCPSYMILHMTHICGMYKVEVSYDYMPCNFTPENHQLEWIVTAVAPESAVHEAFFDPP